MFFHEWVSGRCTSVGSDQDAFGQERVKHVFLLYPTSIFLSYDVIRAMIFLLCIISVSWELLQLIRSLIHIWSIFDSTEL